MEFARSVLIKTKAKWKTFRNYLEIFSERYIFHVVKLKYRNAYKELNEYMY